MSRLLSHAEALIGARLSDIAEGLGLPVPAGTVRSKGWTGQIIELELAGAEESSRARPTGAGPDFPELGLELKTVPVDHALVPRESTAVCVIDPIAITRETWGTSAVRTKLRRVLWVAVEVPPPAPRMTGRAAPASVGDRIVRAARLWSPSPAEDEVLRRDFEELAGYFRAGEARALTGSIGRALHVRPKGRDRDDTRTAYDADGRRVLVGRSGFYLRPRFVHDILRQPRPDAHASGPNAPTSASRR